MVRGLIVIGRFWFILFNLFLFLKVSWLWFSNYDWWEQKRNRKLALELQSWCVIKRCSTKSVSAQRVNKTFQPSQWNLEYKRKKFQLVYWWSLWIYYSHSVLGQVNIAWVAPVTVCYILGPPQTKETIVQQMKVPGNRTKMKNMSHQIVRLMENVRMKLPKI